MNIRNFSSKLASRLIISTLTILLTLLALDLIVRWVPLYPEKLSTHDPQIGSVFIPGASGVQMNPACWLDYRQRVAINSKGLRDNEHSYQRDDLYRILFLGDSFVASKQVPLVNTFHIQLEEMLNVEVIAAGHGGWSTDAELLWYRKEGYKYNPDLVVVLYQPGNDVQDNSITINYVPNKHPYFTLERDTLIFHPNLPEEEISTSGKNLNQNRIHSFLLEHSYLYKLFIYRARVAQLSLDSVPTITTEDKDKTVIANHKGKDLYQVLYDDAFELTFALIDQLRQEVKADGARFAVALASSDRQIYFGGDNSREVSKLTEMNIIHWDLLPAIRAAHREENPMHFYCDGHWTIEGHTVVAESLEEYLSPLVTKDQ